MSFSVSNDEWFCQTVVSCCHNFHTFKLSIWQMWTNKREKISNDSKVTEFFHQYSKFVKMECNTSGKTVNYLSCFVKPISRCTSYLNLEATFVRPLDNFRVKLIFHSWKNIPVTFFMKISIYVFHKHLADQITEKS